MPEHGDVFAVFRSVAVAVAITISAYGFGRPLARWFECARRDRLERGVFALLLGFPTAGLGLAVLGLLGGLGTISLAAMTLVGLLLASVEVACSIAHLDRHGGLFGSLRTLPFSASPLVCRSGCCLAIAVLALTLISALTPPTDPSVLAQTLDAPNNALLAGTFWNGDQDGLQLLSLSQLWSLWGLALDGPVAAGLVHWQLTIVLALAATYLARHWVKPELAWLAGLLALVSTGYWVQVGTFSAGISIGLAGSLVLLAAACVREHGRKAVGQINFAMATLVASLPAASIDLVEFNAWQYPFLLIALSGLMLGAPLQRMAFVASLGLIIAAALLPNGNGLMAIALPGIAVASAAGAAVLLHLPTRTRAALLGLVACLALVQVGDMARSVLPKTGVALGCQSREAYLLAACGSYRAAAVFNQIRLPEQRLFSTSTGCLYFASSTKRGTAIVEASQFAAAEIVAQAREQGCDYLLVAEPLRPETGRAFDSDASDHLVPGGEPPALEKFAGAAEVIPIVEYEFADEYQRTTRYRLWKLQSRRAVASPTFETATSGEGVSSRPRPLTR